MTVLPHNNTPTSIAAAQSMAPHAATIREQIYELIKANGLGGRTADEIEAMTTFSGNCIRPRLKELRYNQRLVTFGDLRPTRTGRMAVVWVAK